MSIKRKKDMITTSSMVTINKVLRLGPVTTYTADKVSLFIKVNGVQKRYDAMNVVNSSGTSTGLVSFVNIPLPVDGNYSFYITGDSSDDLDISGTQLSVLATGFVKKITSTNVLMA